jgi:ligand-binding SRPBCC domain-containing protein
MTRRRPLGMSLKVFRTFLPGVSAQMLWEFHSNVNALVLLTPPGAEVEVIGETTDVFEGALHKIRVKKFGSRLNWIARIHEVNEPKSFRDTAEKSPFKTWTHEHKFEEENGGCWLIDTVEYSLPFGILGWIAGALLVNRDIDNMFAHRHKVTRKHFGLE